MQVHRKAQKKARKECGRDSDRFISASGEGLEHEQCVVGIGDESVEEAIDDPAGLLDEVVEPSAGCIECILGAGGIETALETAYLLQLFSGVLILLHLIAYLVVLGLDLAPLLTGEVVALFLDTFDERLESGNLMFGLHLSARGSGQSEDGCQKEEGQFSHDVSILGVND